MTSLKLARKLTSRFHGLLTEEAKIKADSSLTVEERRTELKRIETEVAAMGGRETYQEASALSTANFRSARYVYKTLVRFGLQPRKGEAPLRVLEIGAVNKHLLVCPWLRTRAVDLESRDPAIEKKDMLAIPVGSTYEGDRVAQPACSRLRHSASLDAARLERPTGYNPSGHQPSGQLAGHKRPREESSGGAGAGAAAARGTTHDSDDEGDDGADGSSAGDAASVDHSGEGSAPSLFQRDAAAVRVLRGSSSGGRPVTGNYDIVVCAMVVNCVFEPEKRVEMLLKCRDHLVPGGLFYFAIPSRCLDMSAYVTRSMFEGLLVSMGFAFKHEKRTPKISFYMMQRVDVLPLYDTVGSAAAASAATAGGAGGAAARQSGLGSDWKPVIVTQTPVEVSLMRRFQPPPRQLPPGELPVTGFTRTEFSLAIPPAWVTASEGGHEAGSKSAASSSSAAAAPAPAAASSSDKKGDKAAKRAKTGTGDAHKR